MKMHATSTNRGLNTVWSNNPCVLHSGVHSASPEQGTAPPVGQVASDADAASPPASSEGSVKTGDVGVTVAAGVDGTVADAQASGRGCQEGLRGGCAPPCAGRLRKVLRSPWRNEAPAKVNMK
jgi:hypothetical protein